MAIHFTPAASTISRALAARVASAALILVTVLQMTGCAPAPARHTPYSAGVLAARLANEECRQRYGETPFAPQDFETLLEDGRWRWGGEGTGPVDGYSVTVTFAPDGTGRQVRVGRGEELDLGQPGAPTPAGIALPPLKNP
jgi:hypothetical protein